MDFTRKKVFRSIWRVRSFLAGTEREPSCTAQVDICFVTEERDGVLGCKAKWYQLKEVKAVIDDSFGTQIPLIGKPHRERDDLRELKLSLVHLSENGTPEGEAFEERFSDFIVE